MAAVYQHSSAVSSTERAPLYSDGIVSFHLQRSVWRRRVRTHRKGRLRDGEPEMVRDCCFNTVMEYLELCGEWWEQSLKERGKKRVYRFQGWPVKKCFQCCQTEKTAASVKELLSASFHLFTVRTFFPNRKNNFFSPEIFFSFTRGENVFLLLFCDFFFFFPQSLSHIAFLCFFLVKVSRKKFTKK